MKKASFIALSVVFVLLIMMLSGCGGGNGSGNTENASSPGGEEPGKNGGYTVKHAMGETYIEGTPERVVVLTNEGTEALLALGVKPVGAVKSWTGDPWYDHIRDQMDGVVNVGLEGEPNIEEILKLKPDLIIGNKMRHEKIYNQLNAIAKTVFSETLRGEWKNNFKLYAEALNKKEEGEKVLADFDKRVEDIRSKAGEKLEQEVSIVRFMPGVVRIYQKDTFSGIILEQIGFKRPPSQDVDEFAVEVGPEQIPDMDGDILFYFTYETGDGKATELEKEWLNHPLWKNLNVVKNNRVYKVDDAIWNTAGGVLAANKMLDDLYRYFELTP